MGPYMHSISFHGDVTFLGQVPVEHQFAMPQVVQHWPKVCGVSVNEIGTGFILEKKQKQGAVTISGKAKSTFVATKKKSGGKCSTQSALVEQGLKSNT